MRLSISILLILFTVQGEENNDHTSWRQFHGDGPNQGSVAVKSDFATDQLWKAQAGFSISSSPVIASDGTIYIGSDKPGQLVAVNANGKIRWRTAVTQGKDALMSTPAIAENGRIYVISTVKQTEQAWGEDNYATSVAFGDVDGDGKDEMAFGRNTTENFRVKIVDDRDTEFAQLFQTGGKWGSGNYVTSVAFGDVDGDGRDELAYTRKAPEGHRIRILDDKRADFAELFHEGSTWGSDNYATSIAFGDVDGDGRDELAYARKTPEGYRIKVLDDKSAGFTELFQEGSTWGSGNYATSVAFGDVDGDGRDELAYARKANGDHYRVRILDDGQAGFKKIYEFGSDWGDGNYVTAIAFGNVDADPREELAFTRNTKDNFRVKVLDDQNAGFAELFQDGTGWGKDNYATSIAFGNIDGDPKEELAYTRKSPEGHRIRILDDRGTGFTEIFQSGRIWGEKNYATAVAFGNVDRDRRDELAYTRKTTGDVFRVKVLDDQAAYFAGLFQSGADYVYSDLHILNTNGELVHSSRIGGRGFTSASPKAWSSATDTYVFLQENRTLWVYDGKGNIVANQDLSSCTSNRFTGGGWGFLDDLWEVLSNIPAEFDTKAPPPDLLLEPTVAILDGRDFDYVKPPRQPLVVLASPCSFSVFRWNPPKLTLLHQFSFKEPYEFTSPAVFANQLAVMGSRDGTVLAFNVLSGKEEWKYAAGEKIRASAVSSSRHIYVVSRTHIHKLTPNGKLVAKAKLTEEAFASPALASNHIYVSMSRIPSSDLSTSGGLLTFSVDLNKEGFIATPGFNQASPALGKDGTIYHSSGGTLYAFGPGQVTQKIK